MGASFLRQQVIPKARGVSDSDGRMEIRLNIRLNAKRHLEANRCVYEYPIQIGVLCFNRCGRQIMPKIFPMLNT